MFPDTGLRPRRTPLPAGSKLSYKVLLVDSDAARAERIQRPLSELGFSVVLSPETLDALAQFESERPDLVVIETASPNRQGLELCQSLKETPRGRSTPIVVAVECEPGQSLRAQALDRYGCDSYLEAPIADAQLIEACQRLLARSSCAPSRHAGSALRMDDLATGDALVDESSLADALGALEAIPESLALRPVAAPANRHLAATESQPTVPNDSEAPDWTCVALSETLDELSRVSDELIDRLPIPDPTPPPAVATPATDRGDSMDSLRQSVAELSCSSIDDSKATPPSPPIEFAGDRGEDIDDVLATVLAPLPPKPPKAPRRPAGVSHSLGLAQAAPSAIPLSQPTIRRLDRPGQAVPPSAIGSPEVARDRPAEIRQSSILAESGSSSPDPRSNRDDESIALHGHRRPRASRLLIAAVAVTIAGIGVWLLLTRSSLRPPESGATEAVRVASSHFPSASAEAASASLTPDLGPTASWPRSDGEAAGSIDGGLDSEAIVDATSVVPEAKTPNVDPAPPTVRKASPQATPSPRNPAETTRTLVRIRGGSAPEGQVQRLTVPPPPSIGGRAAVVSPTNPPADTVMPEIAANTTLTETAAAAMVLGTPKSIEIPEIPPYESPMALRRVEPTLPPRALTAGESAVVVLRVLVNESGRVVRVVVDSGIPGSKLEAAAIDAVLGWEYRPASENGHTIRAWTTERFEFNAPSN